MQDIISVTQNKCKQCYSCVRNCQVKAVQITNGQAQIVHSRCINCGKCIKSCPQGAKIVLDSKGKALEILKKDKKVVACLAPSFAASFGENEVNKVIGAIKELGFSEVWETAIGAELLAREIDDFIKVNPKKTYLNSSCPAFVSMIEKHYPELIKYLLPFVSPMVATGRVIKEKYKNDDVKVVFIGPCVAKKAEADEPQFRRSVDVVLTFDELKEMFKEKGINVNRSRQDTFDSIYSKKGKLFPLSGGLLVNLEISKQLKETEYSFIEGDKECLKLIEALSNGRTSIKIADILMCEGCIEGPKIDSQLNHFEKKNRILNYYEESIEVNDKSQESSKEIALNADFIRKYRNKRSIMPFPSEEEIQEVLRQTNKFAKEDELNCGACGYTTCREKAIAVLQGIAEVDMCFPYLLSKKTKLLDELSIKFNEISELKEQLETIIQSSYDGLVVTDGYGNVQKTNRAWKRMTGYSDDKEETSVQKIEEKNIVFPSATMLALREKRRISFMQKGKDGKNFLSTATPIFDENGNIKRVVTNIRDINELNKLRNQLEETKKLEKYHNSDKGKREKIEFNTNNLVVNSQEFGEVLQISSNISTVDSTVLILGESGVGKEVVAKFIQNLSDRKDKPFVKINCGAIPENLIESELFGYETGAFTGARSKGKPGLIELAHEGTLFLDEIGELPLNLQVKLLRFLQEKKIVRIGGTKEKNVDTRVIAATNRDLYKMAMEGNFRLDLYYRLNVVPIEIPPLRNRKSDIIPLCYHFIKYFNKKYSCNKDITSEVEKVLLNYTWPGNIRELENIIERLIVTTTKNIIDEKDLPLFLYNEGSGVYQGIMVEGIIPIKEAVEIVEKKLVEKAYAKYGTTYEMAKALNINQSTVVRKIQKYIKNDALEHN
ncbi:sigma 54-interacting transcriptional regulator [Sporosalibacterium faouarense]|uniref:sigma 54-interacting transcriptional regulator n=1 Tax=Sporosalibacterium faouarense TaxID=516123 RepID=UPI00192AB769|nr:sigma 54-interacting transcriptional regulator [Sporosalibacterium faouarense]